jgi:hypothetical protein
MHRRLPILLGAALLCVPLLAQAGAKPEGGRRRERMRTFLVFWIADALDLSEEKALQVSKVLRDSEGRRRQLIDERRGVERALQAALDQTPPDSSALGTLITQANDIDARVAMMPENTFAEVQALLTIEQQARLVLLRRELQGQIRRNVERRLRESRGP